MKEYPNGIYTARVREGNVTITGVEEELLEQAMLNRKIRENREAAMQQDRMDRQARHDRQLIAAARRREREALLRELGILAMIAIGAMSLGGLELMHPALSLGIIGWSLARASYQLGQARRKR